MIYDSDMLAGTEKKAVLRAILESGKPFTVIHGAAGSGKTTMAKLKIGQQFLMSVDDVKKSDNFVIISGAGRTKSGEVSKAVADMVSKCESLFCVVVPNMEIRRRRIKRFENGSLDNRSDKALKGSMRAPLNQFDYISKLRKIAKKSEIVS